MFYFSCFLPEQTNNIDTRPIYNNQIDSVFSLNQRIQNKDYKPTDFDTKFLEENSEFLVNNEFDENIRNILFYKLCILINYNKTNPIILNNIDDMRIELSKKLRYNMLPVFFQNTKYLDSIEKLKDIIFNKIQFNNIKLINKLIII